MVWFKGINLPALSGLVKSYMKVPSLFPLLSLANRLKGSLDTMRQLKKDVTEVRKGTECGLSFKEFSDLQAGDVIQMYDKIEKPGVI